MEYAYVRQCYSTITLPGVHFFLHNLDIYEFFIYLPEITAIFKTKNEQLFWIVSTELNTTYD